MLFDLRITILCAFHQNVSRFVAGTIYEGTSNIQLNTIAKLIEAEARNK